MGDMGAGLTLVWLNPFVYVPTKSTAAKAKPVLVAGAFIVHSDVLLVLSLQGHCGGVNSWFAQLRGEISAFLP